MTNRYKAKNDQGQAPKPQGQGNYRKIPHSRIQIPRDHIHTYITSITGAQKSRYVCLEGFSYEISEPTKAVRGQKCYGLWETF